jgi:hypothetical protein
VTAPLPSGSAGPTLGSMVQFAVRRHPHAAPTGELEHWFGWLIGLESTEDGPPLAGGGPADALRDKRATNGRAA